MSFFKRLINLSGIWAIDSLFFYDYLNQIAVKH